MDKKAERKIKLLARLLAVHYGYDGSEMACACTGLSGVCLHCATWWKLFLTHWSAEQVGRIIGAYLVAVGDAAP